MNGSLLRGACRFLRRVVAVMGATASVGVAIVVIVVVIVSGSLGCSCELPVWVQLLVFLGEYPSLLAECKPFSVRQCTPLLTQEARHVLVVEGWVLHLDLWPVDLGKAHEGVHGARDFVFIPGAVLGGLPCHHGHCILHCCRLWSQRRWHLSNCCYWLFEWLWLLFEWLLFLLRWRK